MSSWSSGRLVLSAVAALACLALLAPSGASAATIVNGDFESGTLQGWKVHRVTGSGNWFAYQGIDEPIANQRGRKPPQPPPQGTFAAVSDQASVETLVLSQEIVLAPGLNHRLSLLAYYDTIAPLAVPAPDTLSVDGELLGGQANQQFRIDVMRPGAAIESLDPADVLATAFRTRPGGPLSLGPTWVTADLSPFAGQAVVLRIATVAHEELLTGGVDAISVDSTRPGKSPPPLGSNRFSFGKVKLNRSNGTATLAVEVPGPGELTAKDSASAKAGVSKAKKPARLIKPATARAADAGTVKIRLRPTAAALAILERKQKLRVRVAVTYAPAGGKPATATAPVVLKLALRPHRR